VSPSRWRRLLVATLALCCAAPTAGDIGSCGQEAEELDPVKFFAQKGGIDRSRCEECGISSARCEARHAGELEATEFPEDCFPLVHDGEVCLRALLDAGCGDYEEYMRDVGPTVPTECNFCPPRGAGGAGSGP
jgi:hypothetical protein